MARSQRSGKLETRTARLKLPQGAREFLTIGKGLALGYRRTEGEYGTWQARVWDGSRYHYQNLGRADDFQDANGEGVLDFYQAQGAARTMYEEVLRGGAPTQKDVTVQQAADRYLEWFRAHRKGVAMAESAVRAHITPALGDRRLADLTTADLRAWLDKLATKAARLRSSKLSKKLNLRPAAETKDEKRARRASANRILSVLKAILNRAFQDSLVADDSAWRKVKPFAKVDEARIRYLTDAEATRLVNACPLDLRRLVRAALLTGTRWGELAALKVADVNLKTAQIYIAESKSGKPRHVPLNPEGVAHFEELVTGKTGDELVLTRQDGTAWGHNYHVRALEAACKIAKVKPVVSFHELRHTYASHLAQAGVDLLTISKLLGHADTRITAKHYAHLADKTLAQAVTKLPSFSGAAKPSHLVRVSL
jgi:integrase